MPKEIPAGDRDRQREIAERAGAKDPAIEINKKKEEDSTAIRIAEPGVDPAFGACADGDDAGATRILPADRPA